MVVVDYHLQLSNKVSSSKEVKAISEDATVISRVGPDSHKALSRLLCPDQIEPYTHESY